MKSKEFKSYCRDFPWLPHLLRHWIMGGKEPQAKDLAFVAVRPWEKLELSDSSQHFPTGYVIDQMCGDVLYAVIWKKHTDDFYRGSIIEATYEKWRHRSVGRKIERIHKEEVEAVAKEPGTFHFITYPPIIFAVARITFTRIHSFFSPMAVEVYRHPDVPWEPLKGLGPDLSLRVLFTD